MSWAVGGGLGQSASVVVGSEDRVGLGVRWVVGGGVSSIGCMFSRVIVGESSVFPVRVCEVVRC